MVSFLEIKKDKKKYLIKTNIETLCVFEEVIIEYMLISKRDVSQEKYEEIKKYALYIDKYHLALDYLKKPRTTYELVCYLKQNNSYDSKIIDNLQTKGFLNDELYMKMYVDYQKSINYKGPLLIKKELEKKGIKLDFNYGDEKENIDYLTNKYLKNNTKKNTKALNQGLYIYLVNKGYHANFTNYEGNDSELVKVDFKKLKQKYEKKYEGYELKQKIYSALLNKGYSNSLIQQYLEKM